MQRILQQPEDSSKSEADIVIQISLRSIVHAAAAACILESAQKLTEQYAKTFDQSLYEIERNRNFLDMKSQVGEALH